jgi:crotonobetainyl-CoA:carnitine CoA-transferase CaiB-like acyl-CoA transferase
MKSLPLENLRVVECGDGVAAAFATKLLPLLGADVVKVEATEGDSTRFRGPFFGERVDPASRPCSIISTWTKRCEP